MVSLPSLSTLTKNQNQNQNQNQKLSNSSPVYCLEHQVIGLPITFIITIDYTHFTPDSMIILSLLTGVNNDQSIINTVI
jgi:hypothetical protein